MLVENTLDSIGLVCIRGNPWHITQHDLTNSILFYGYLQERARMSDISVRCHHHNDQFNHNPKHFISYFADLLYTPLQNKNTKRYCFDAQDKRVEYILIFVSNGICEICALYLASELQLFFPIIQDHEVHFRAVNLFGHILTVILQYPSVASYCFSLKHYNLWAVHIFGFLQSFGYMHQQSFLNDFEEKRMHLEFTYRGLFIFGVQIMRNSHLLKFEHWNCNVLGFTKWIVTEIKCQINTGTEYEYQLSPLFNVYFMVISYFYKCERKHLKLNAKAILILRNELCAIIKHEIKDVEMYNNKIIKGLCIHLLEITDKKSRKKILKKYRDGLKQIKHKVWKQKKNDMTCLWHKCNIKTADLIRKSLYKCNRCKVARYCSKKCQKKDWNVGYHKELCNKYK